MKYLLDTCVVSETTRAQPNQGVMEWLRALDERHLSLSVLTIGELEKGIERLHAGKRRTALRVWLEELKSAYDQKVLDVTLPIAAEWGHMVAEAERRGETLAAIDGLIAATARIHELTLVTRNTADMRRTGALLFDPWEA
ncbi:MAG: type II toxin-antitoxin system VapC family toxin [Polyangiaceae bacterium]|nr:type II toxin-antitoxin system VapC family toxin [Polyangiaceae bacterium]